MEEIQIKFSKIKIIVIKFFIKRDGWELQLMDEWWYERKIKLFSQRFDLNLKQYCNWM